MQLIVKLGVNFNAKVLIIFVSHKKFSKSG